jgi:hypothetical protein
MGSSDNGASRLICSPSSRFFTGERERERDVRAVVIMEGELERREEVYLKAVFLEVSPLCTRFFGACCSILLILG